MRIDMRNQFIRIFAHFKEISFLFRRSDFPSAIRAFPVYKLRFRPERFTGRTVKPLIGALINISLLIQLLENFLHLLFMITVGRTNELIIRGIQRITDRTDFSRNAVHKLFRRNAGFLRF